ncbi:MAG: DUF4271 domain-containing protein [Prevotellaceae bacterium]|jgi:hypothetical protein|nr:DUF4271 domain-containing protein [Prevotellaceae bacterium]
MNEIEKTLSLSSFSPIVILLIFSVLLLAFVLRNSKEIYFQRIQNIYSVVTMQLSQNKKVSLREDAFSKVAMWFLALLGFSFFIVLLNNFDNLQKIPFYKKDEIINDFFLQLTAIFAVSGIILFFKRHFFGYLQRVFDLNRHNSVLFRNTFLSVFSLLGIFLFFLSFLYVFLPSFQFSLIVFGVILMVFSALFLCFVCLKIFFNGIVSLFYFFLYLCALEILPVLVVKKLLIQAYETTIIF